MRASLMTRAGTVAAAAAIATTGVMATAAAADASTAHSRLGTHLGVAKRHAVEHGHHFTVLLGRLVFLDRVTKKGLVQVGHERTGAHGRVAFAVDPKGIAVFVLVFKGTPHLHASHSHAVIVRH
jgi:hypothetical protein